MNFAAITISATLPRPTDRSLDCVDSIPTGRYLHLNDKGILSIRSSRQAPRRSTHARATSGLRCNDNRPALRNGEDDQGRLLPSLRFERGAGNRSGRAVTEPFFAAADYHAKPNALSRVLAYLDLRETMIDGDVDAFTCLAGTLAQEVHQSHPKIARAAQAAIEGHARTLEADLASAIGSGPGAAAEARSLALHIQVVLQGAFVIAKAQGNTDAARQSVRYLKSYITMICKGAGK